MKIVSWNVLSPGLIQPQRDAWCEEGRFYKDQSILEEGYRLKKFVEKIRGWMDAGYIIALQEVSKEWWNSREIQEYIQEYHYETISDFYGTEIQHYMGVVLCVPLDQYEIREKRTKRIQDVLEAIQKESYGRELPREEEIILRKGRKDVSVMLRVKKRESEEEEMWITTIHFPCWYFCPLFMKKVFQKMMTELAKEVMHTEIGLLCIGDLNMSPIQIEEAIKMYQRNMLIKIQTLLGRKEEEEGLCTTVSVGNRDPYKKYNEHSFAGCLDNCIWIQLKSKLKEWKYDVDWRGLPRIGDREGWREKMKYPRYTQEEESEVVPNRECISDHYPIYVERKEFAF
jgi:endonuclease/exonuclease/phosphatase family metal-dependent hydrolase